MIIYYLSHAITYRLCFIVWTELPIILLQIGDNNTLVNSITWHRGLFCCF